MRTDTVSEDFRRFAPRFLARFFEVKSPHAGWRIETSEKLRGCAVMMLMAFIAGCAGYHPKPLDDNRLNKSLAAPDRVALAREAARLRHPRLPPMALDFSQPLTGEALGVIAVLASPDLQAFRAKEGVAQAQVFAAGLLPDPQLAVGLDHPLGGGGLVNAQNLGLSWDVARLITRQGDMRIANNQALQVRNDIAWQEWLVANQAALMGRRVAYLERQQAMAQQFSDIAAKLLEVARRNLREGNVKIDEVGLRQVAYLDARDRVLALARELQKARQDLNRVLGLLPGEIVLVATFRISLPASLPDPEALFTETRTARLDLAALRAGYDTQEARVYRAVLGQYPRFNLGLSEVRDTAGVRSQSIGISLDIPLFNSANRGVIAEAEATRDKLYAEYLARLYQTRADIATLIADLYRIGQEYEALVQQLPELERVERVLRAAVASGDTSLVNYETVRATLLDKQIKLLSLEQAAAEQEVALQLASGALLAL